MAVPFGPYEGQDLTEYEAGNKFLPRQFYSLGFSNTPPPSIANPATTSGIANTQAASPYIWPPQGGGNGGATGSGNKFGLNMDTLKTVTGGQWSTDNNPFGYGSYKETPRQIAQTEGGIWKDINTNQNVYHGNIDYRGIVGTIADKVIGRKSRPGFPDEGSWTGEDWDEDFDPRFAGTRLNTYQRWKEKRNIVKAQEKAEQQAAAKQAEAQSRQAATDQSRINRAYREETGGQAGSYAPGGGSGEHAPDASGSTYSDPFDPGGGEKEGGLIRKAYGGRIGYNRGRVVNPGGYNGVIDRNIANLKAALEYSDLTDEERAQIEADLQMSIEAKGGWEDQLLSGDPVSQAEGGRIGYQDGEFVEDVNVEGPGYDENIEEVQGEPNREQLEAIALEIFQLPLEQLDEEQLMVVYQAAMEQEPYQEDVQFAEEGPGQGIASLV